MKNNVYWCVSMACFSSITLKDCIWLLHRNVLEASNIHNSLDLAPAKAYLVSLSLAFVGLHCDVIKFSVASAYGKLLKK